MRRHGTGRKLKLIGFWRPAVPAPVIDLHLPVPVAHSKIGKASILRASWGHVITGVTLRSKTLNGSVSHADTDSTFRRGFLVHVGREVVRAGGKTKRRWQ